MLLEQPIRLNKNFFLTRTKITEHIASIFGEAVQSNPVKNLYFALCGVVKILSHADMDDGVIMSNLNTEKSSNAVL